MELFDPVAEDEIVVIKHSEISAGGEIQGPIERRHAVHDRAHIDSDL